jgi:RNA polymerase sigma-70 factor, ECF subfamily
MLGTDRGGASTNGAPGVDEDLVLLHLVAQGEQEALLKLHKRYVNLVYSMAWRVLQDVGKAEEVTQDIFLKLWQKGQQYDPARGRFSTWLLSVTRFAAIDALRRDRRRPRVTEIDQGPDDAAPALERLFPTDHAAWERGQHLRLLLTHLPKEQQQVVELAFFGGMTHTELAEYLGLPLGTVKGRLRLGIEKLRVLWMDEMSVRK